MSYVLLMSTEDDENSSGGYYQNVDATTSLLSNLPNTSWLQNSSKNNNSSLRINNKTKNASRKKTQKVLLLKDCRCRCDTAPNCTGVYRAKDQKVMSQSAQELSSEKQGYRPCIRPKYVYLKRDTKRPLDEIPRKTKRKGKDKRYFIRKDQQASSSPNKPQQQEKAEKMTYCRPTYHFVNEDYMAKAEERRNKLQNIVQKLIEARQIEKQRETWNNFINELKNKHGVCDVHTHEHELINDYGNVRFEVQPAIQRSIKYCVADMYPHSSSMVEQEIKSNIYDYQNPTLETTPFFYEMNPYFCYPHISTRGEPSRWTKRTCDKNICPEAKNNISAKTKKQHEYSDESEFSRDSDDNFDAKSGRSSDYNGEYRDQERRQTKHIKPTDRATSRKMMYRSEMPQKPTTTYPASNRKNDIIRVDPERRKNSSQVANRTNPPSMHSRYSKIFDDLATYKRLNRDSKSQLTLEKIENKLDLLIEGISELLHEIKPKREISQQHSNTSAKSSLCHECIGNDAVYKKVIKANEKKTKSSKRQKVPSDDECDPCSYQTILENAELCSSKSEVESKSSREQDYDARNRKAENTLSYECSKEENTITQAKRKKSPENNVKCNKKTCVTDTCKRRTQFVGTTAINDEDTKPKTISKDNNTTTRTNNIASKTQNKYADRKPISLDRVLSRPRSSPVRSHGVRDNFPKRQNFLQTSEQKDRQKQNFSPEEKRPNLDRRQSLHGRDCFKDAFKSMRQQSREKKQNQNEGCKECTEENNAQKGNKTPSQTFQTRGTKPNKNEECEECIELLKTEENNAQKGTKTPPLSSERKQNRNEECKECLEFVNSEDDNAKEGNKTLPLFPQIRGRKQNQNEECEECIEFLKTEPNFAQKDNKTPPQTHQSGKRKLNQNDECEDCVEFLKSEQNYLLKDTRTPPQTPGILCTSGSKVENKDKVFKKQRWEFESISCLLEKAKSFTADLEDESKKEKQRTCQDICREQNQFEDLFKEQSREDSSLLLLQRRNNSTHDKKDETSDSVSRKEYIDDTTSVQKVLNMSRGSSPKRDDENDDDKGNVNKRNDNFVCAVVESQCSPFFSCSRFRDSRIDRIIIEEMDKSDQAKRDIEEILNGELTNTCAVSFAFDVPTKDIATEVTNSLSATLPHRRNNLCSYGSRTKMITTVAVNTDPMSFLALLRISTDTISNLLGQINLNRLYNSFAQITMAIPRSLPANINSLRQIQRDIAGFSCNVCGLVFSSASQLSMHIRDHRNGNERDCCVCRHLLDMRRRRHAGLFTCVYCGQCFTRAYCCELHQHVCARKRGLRTDVPENLSILS